MISTGAWISLSGEWDVSRKEELLGLLEPAVLANDVTVDCQEVAFVDASVLGCLVRFVNKRSRHGLSTVRLIGAAPFLSRLLSLTKLDSVFAVEDPPFDGLPVWSVDCQQGGIDGFRGDHETC